MNDTKDMKEPKKPLFKICGLTRPEDAVLVAALGADMCGFIFHPKSPRRVSPKQARLLATPAARRVGVFVDQSLPEILEIMEEACLDAAQLHGRQGPEVASALGFYRSIRVFWPERQSPAELQEQMDQWKELAHLFLFDAGSGAGGHGRPINAVIPESPADYLLAGGLTPDSVWRKWPPEDPKMVGFDVNSGVESSPGVKDREALRRLLLFR
ncbi:MAG: phosphoribosylanthranilate isomerase [Deltaproteobacteria bacterium]|jgi:phosphoribosylanthranilate isomerase|nr:phosphoribosylanthranilate isomerase [Deltaproteobacteria bacterium]